MTRKDYIIIADAISDVGNHNATDDDYREGWHAANSAIAHKMASALAAENHRFDRNKFLIACGMSVPA